MIKVFNKSKRPIFIAGIQILPKESFTWVETKSTKPKSKSKKKINKE